MLHISLLVLYQLGAAAFLISYVTVLDIRKGCNSNNIKAIAEISENFAAGKWPKTFIQYTETIIFFVFLSSILISLIFEISIILIIKIILIWSASNSFLSIESIASVLISFKVSLLIESFCFVLTFPVSRGQYYDAYTSVSPGNLTSTLFYYASFHSSSSFIKYKTLTQWMLPHLSQENVVWKIRFGEYWYY